MARHVQVFDLAVEIAPFSPTVERPALRISHIIVSAAPIAFRPRIAAALAKLLEDLSRPPVEMGIDDPHGVYLDRLGFAYALGCYAGTLFDPLPEHSTAVRGNSLKATLVEEIACVLG